MPKKGYKQTEEHKEKVQHALKGKKQTEEQIRKRVIAMLNKK